MSNALTQTPTIGRIVHYKLSVDDALAINNKRLENNSAGNVAFKGDVYPATIVRVWSGDYSGVQLQVHLDGPDAHWATSRTEGESEGQWIWPPR